MNTEELGAMIHIRNGNVGMDALTFDGDQIFFGAIFAVAGDLSGPEFPAEAQRQSKSSIGWLSMTSDGVTKAARMMRARPPSTT